MPGESRCSRREIQDDLGRISGTLEMLRAAMSDLKLSARADDPNLKAARTRVELAASDPISSDHIGEAIRLRCLDRQLWT